MPLPTGQISMSEVNVELGLSATAQLDMNNAALRALAGVPSGAISMSNLQGKANAFAYTIASNQNNLDLRSNALANGWNGSSTLTVTVASGVTISATSTGSYAMTISGSFPGGLTLINSGAIQGMGGAGGTSPVNGINGSTAGSAGGPGLLVQSPVSINNAGRIAGGGGGGPSGFNNFPIKGTTFYGGGGGGGRSGTTNSSGGTAGTLISGQQTGPNPEPGQPGTISSAGAGGRGSQGATPSGSFALTTDPNFGAAAAGGDWGAAGVTLNVTITGTPLTSLGGAGGAAIAGNSNITWIATGTRLGAIT